MMVDTKKIDEAAGVRMGTYSNKVHYVVINLQLLERSQENSSRKTGGMSVSSSLRRRKS